MHQAKMRNISGLFLLSAALFQFVLLITSMVTSFFFLGEYSGRLQELSCLIAQIILVIAAIGAFQMCTSRETIAHSQRIDISFGMCLGTILAILLYMPHAEVELLWAALGWSLLIDVFIQSSPVVSPYPLSFVLLSLSIYAIFAVSYSIRAFLVTWHSGSVIRGIWSIILTALATFLSAALTFSFIDMFAYFLFHTGSGLVTLGSYSGISPLVNYIASYQSSVQLIAIWFFFAVIPGLLIALISSFISRYGVSPSTLV